MRSSRPVLVAAALIVALGAAAAAMTTCRTGRPGAPDPVAVRDEALGSAAPDAPAASAHGRTGGAGPTVRAPRPGRADGVTLVVSVRDVQGRAVAGATVIVLPIDVATGGHVEAGAVVGRTDPAGDVAFEGLSASGSHEVCVRADGLVPTGRRFVGPGVKSADVKMRPVARHRVRLVDQDGAGLPGVVVTMARMPRTGEGRDVIHIAETTTGPDGAFEFAHEPGAAEEIRGWIREPAGGPWHLGGALEGIPWKPGEDSLRVARAWAIHGFVRTHDGRPLRGVAIRLRGTRGQLLSPHSFPDGSFHVFGLDRDESVGLRADVRCATAPPDDAPGWTFFRGGQTGAELVADPGAYVVVKLDYQYGPEFGPGVLTWSPRAADAADVTLDFHDHVLIGGLDPARTYSFSAGPTELFGKVAVARDVVPDGRTISLEYRDGVPTRGVVRNADGSPRTGEIGVSAWTMDEPRVRLIVVRSDGTGAFEFPGLAPGRWVLRTDEETHPWGETEAEAGAAGIEIRTDRARHRPLRAGSGR